MLKEESMLQENYQSLLGVFIGMSKMAMSGVVVIILWNSFENGNLENNSEEGNVSNFISLAKIMQTSLSQLSVLWTEINKISHSLHKIENILFSEEIENLEEGLQPDSFEGNVAFNNVSFKYPSAENFALRDFNIQLETGKTIALVGGNFILFVLWFSFQTSKLFILQEASFLI